MHNQIKPPPSDAANSDGEEWLCILLRILLASLEEQRRQWNNGAN